MKRIDDLVINEMLIIKETIKKIDENGKKIVFVVGQDAELVGTVTDGDVRRWILKNGSLDESVSIIMNSKPIFVTNYNKEKVYQIMKEKEIEAIPLVDDAGVLKDVFFWSDFFIEKISKYGLLDLPVVIMAGGKGSRLYPYTKILPKPLIPIGETPIVERIINRFHNHGCKNFYMTVNYKKNMIRSYFSEIEKDYMIHYIEEDEPLGTGGSLALLKDSIKETFFLSNCDILIDADYASIYRYHKENQNKITMVTSLKKYTIPYGVVSIDEASQVVNIQEKPENHYLVNTGMYVIEPELIDYIPENQFYHITHLVEKCIIEKVKVGTYPISEGSWLDMGEFKEMDVMLEKLGIK